MKIIVKCYNYKRTTGTEHIKQLLALSHLLINNSININ